MSILTTCSGSSTRQRVARDCHETFFISRRRATLNLIGWQSGFLIKTKVTSGVGRTRAAATCAAEAIPVPVETTSVQFVTSKFEFGGEIFVPCQKKKLSNEPVKTSARASHHPLRRGSLSGKKWNTSAKANTARAHPSKPSPSACQKHAAQE